MAPSSRKSRATKLATQTPTIKISSFGRVTKSSHLNVLQSKPTDAQKAAYVKLLGDKEKKVKVELVQEIKQIEKIDTSVTVKKSSKRKIEEVESEDEGQRDRDVVVARKNVVGRKVKLRKVQLLSPPASVCETDNEPSSPTDTAWKGVKVAQQLVELPSTLQDVLSLHEAFLRALSLHFAHNGASSPAELNTLMASVTRMWKKSAVSREMVQRMLAMYEIASGTDMAALKMVRHRNGPFKLVTSGLGVGTRTIVEFLDRQLSTGAFEEKKLQKEYEMVVRSAFNMSRKPNTGFIHGPISEFPMLAIPIGTQTQARQEKVSATRNEILSLSNAAQSRSLPNFAKLSIDSDQPDSMSTSASTKSRTLSLFDRVRAKGLASASNAAPTNEQILRRHAIGRIGEVVEFLRMKQQQKIGAQFMSSVHDQSEQVVRGKISFSLNSIVNEIRQSVPIPIGDEEVRCCLRILSQEVPQWLSCLNMGTVQSVTLVGSGVSGFQVKKMIEDKERRV